MEENIKGKNKDVNLKEVTEIKEEKTTKKVKGKKIKMSLTKAEEKRIDKEVENSDRMSILVMVVILVVCFVLGISLGYVLYRLALTGGF